MRVPETLFLRALILFISALLSWPNHLTKRPLLPNIITFGIRILAHEFWRWVGRTDTSNQAIALPVSKVILDARSCPFVQNMVFLCLIRSILSGTWWSKLSFSSLKCAGWASYPVMFTILPWSFVVVKNLSLACS